MKKSLVCLCLCLTLLALGLLPGCGAKKESVDLETVYAAVTALPDLPGMDRLGAEQIQRYYGIDPAACPQLLVAQCEDGLRVDEIWLIEAGSEKDAKELQSLAQSHIQQVCAETENYLPEQYAVAKEGQALCVGSYVGLFLSPEAAAMADLFRQSLKG